MDEGADTTEVAKEEPKEVTEELAISQMNRSLDRLPDQRTRTRVLNYVYDRHTPETATIAPTPG